MIITPSVVHIVHLLLPCPIRSVCSGPEMCFYITCFLKYFLFLFSRHLVEIIISSLTLWHRVLIIFAARVMPKDEPQSICSPTGTPYWAHCVCLWWTGSLASLRTSVWPHGNFHQPLKILVVLQKFSLHFQGGGILWSDQDVQRIGITGHPLNHFGIHYYLLSVSLTWVPRWSQKRREHGPNWAWG